MIPANATSTNPIAKSGSVSIVHGRPVYVKSNARIPRIKPITNNKVFRILLVDIFFLYLLF